MNIRHTLDTQLNVLEQFDPQLPAHYRRTEFLVLGNFDPSLQLSVLEQLDGPRMVACDTMNFWIEGFRSSLTETLRKVDALLINDSEARELSGEHNLVKAARAVRKMGPQILVIKLGENGALLFDDHGSFFSPAFLLPHVTDPTGAGDSFAGGMFGFLAQHGKTDAKMLRQAMVIGTLMASFSVQGFSIDGIRQLSPDQIAERLQQFRDLIHVDFPTLSIR